MTGIGTAGILYGIVSFLTKTETGKVIDKRIADKLGRNQLETQKKALKLIGDIDESKVKNVLENSDVLLKIIDDSKFRK